MGLNTEGGGSGNVIFLTAIGTNKGVRWARRVTADTEGAVERDANCGTVYELYYTSVTGLIESVRIVDKGEYGEELEIRMKDSDPDSSLDFILQTPFNSSLGKGFICRMANVNPDEPAEVGLYSKDKKRYLWINQDGDKVVNPYVKDGEKSLPPPHKKERRGGKTEYDWAEHDDALYEICKEVSIQQGWSSEETFTQTTVVRSDDKTDENEESEEDAPF